MCDTDFQYWKIDWLTNQKRQIFIDSKRWLLNFECQKNLLEQWAGLICISKLILITGIDSSPSDSDTVWHRYWKQSFLNTPRLASFKNCVGNLRDKNAVSDRHTATAALSFLVHHTGLVSIFFVQIMLRHAASFSCRSPSMMMDLRPIEEKIPIFFFLLLLLGKNSVDLLVN